MPLPATSIERRWHRPPDRAALPPHCRRYRAIAHSVVQGWFDQRTQKLLWCWFARECCAPEPRGTTHRTAMPGEWQYRTAVDAAHCSEYRAPLYHPVLAHRSYGRCAVRAARTCHAAPAAAIPPARSAVALSPIRPALAVRTAQTALPNSPHRAVTMQQKGQPARTL